MENNELPSLESELKRGISLLLEILEEKGITEEDQARIDEFNSKCPYHPNHSHICKYCNGVILAMTCKTGEANNHS